MGKSKVSCSFFFTRGVVFIRPWKLISGDELPRNGPQCLCEIFFFFFLETTAGSDQSTSHLALAYFIASISIIRLIPAERLNFSDAVITPLT